MWIVTKTVVLSMLFWGAVVLALSAILSLALSVCAFRLGIASPAFIECLGGVGALVTVVGAVRFAVVAPLLTYEKNSYGPDWQTIQWPPALELVKVNQEVRVPSELAVRLPSSDLRVHLTGR